MPKLQRRLTEPRLAEWAAVATDKPTRKKSGKRQTKSRVQLARADRSARENQVQQFIYCHIGRLPKRRVENLILAMLEAQPEEMGRIVMEKTFERGYETDPHCNVYKNICYEMAIVNDVSYSMAQDYYNQYLKECEVQIRALGDYETEEIMDANDGSTIVLTCKICIVAHRNGEEVMAGDYCHGCVKRVCSFCSKMCVTCTARWCQPCAQETGQGCGVAECCARMYFEQQLGYATARQQSENSGTFDRQEDDDDSWQPNELVAI